jgi:glucose/arabinose dehydrogenase
MGEGAGAVVLYVCSKPERNMTRTILFGALLGACLPAAAQSPLALELETFATGLAGIVDVAHAGDDRIFAVLQPGTIRIVQPDGTVLPTPFLNITARVQDSGNEQGLLGLAFDPNYAQNGRFYVNYTAGSGAGTTRISRFTVTADPNVADPDSEEILYSWPQPFSNHNGGDLEFGPDGMLYVAFGDGGSANDPQNNAQDLTDPLGDIIRIDVSGEEGYTVPTDNPFVSNSAALPEIWAWGLRNPWRIGFDALNGDLWIGDVGQNAWEEVDYWPAGDNSGPNYGWRCREANVPTPNVSQTGCLAASEYVAPAVAINHNAQGWCSVIGGRVYRGSQYYRMDGLYFYTDYCGGQYYSLRRNDAGAWVPQQVLASGQFGFTCIGENAALELFAGNENNGILYRLKDVCESEQPTITDNGAVLTASDADSWQWYLNGVAIPNATEQTYEALEAGTYFVVAALGPNCLLASEPIVVISTDVAALEMNGVVIAPQPANDVLELRGDLRGVQRAQLFDAVGKLVLDRSIVVDGGNAVLSVTELPVGTYVLTLLGADGTSVLRRQVSVAR